MIKKLLLLSVLLVPYLTGYSQDVPNNRNQKEETNNEKRAIVKEDSVPESIFRFVDQEAQPRGGINTFQKYLAKNTSYPEEAKDAGIQGRVVYEFIIGTDGKIRNIRILKDIGGGCGDAVRQVLENYDKKWKPAINDGVAVASYYAGTFNFTLQ